MTAKGVVLDLSKAPWAAFSEVAARNGLSTMVVSDHAVRYSGRKIYFQLTSNERDGTDLTFGRIRPSYRLGIDEAEGISLNVVIGTIEAARRVKAANSPEREFKKFTLTQAFENWLPILLSGNPDLFEKLSRLRFWHTGNWPHDWGQTIKMTAAEIKSNRELMASVAAALPNDA